ncbi:MAG: ATP-binding protein [Gammaproteobacteria bacterium]|nr:ATP-binding protein [Gammaproteobacteria bacterium]
MDARFLAHNSHLIDSRRFAETDPQLRHLASRPLRHRSSLLDRLPTSVPGIYSLGGGRQTGKSTLLKQWMNERLRDGVRPEAIAYFSGELIDDHHSLLLHMEDQLNAAPDTGMNFLIVDEITYIRDWDKAVKYAADAGWLARTALMITGSDLAYVQEARMRFPGRRGSAEVVDFHLHPLSFREFLALEGGVSDLEGSLDEPARIPAQTVEAVFDAFSRYLLHGGYLTAINDLTEYGTVRRGALATYSDWIRGDVLKRGRRETYLREILSAIVTRYGSQVTWNALARDLSIDHPGTVAEYVALLERMDAVCVLSALREDKLTGAPKKAKKLMFNDPFILHAVRGWLTPGDDPFASQIRPASEDPHWASRIVEACVASHLRRFYPTFYIKAQAEVDVAYVRGERFWPVEVKWSNQLRPKALKQIARYANGEIWSKDRRPGEIGGVKVMPLPIQLLRLGPDSGHLS